MTPCAGFEGGRRRPPSKGHGWPLGAEKGRITGLHLEKEVNTYWYLIWAWWDHGYVCIHHLGEQEILEWVHFKQAMGNQRGPLAIFLPKQAIAPSQLSWAAYSMWAQGILQCSPEQSRREEGTIPLSSQNFPQRKACWCLGQAWDFSVLVHLRESGSIFPVALCSPTLCRCAHQSTRGAAFLCEGSLP